MNRYATMTPNEVWELFVGSQSVAEFMELSPDKTPAQAATEYVHESEMCADLWDDDSDDHAVVASKLAEHIRANDRAKMPAQPRPSVTEMMAVIESHGDFAHGGDVEGAVSEWLEAGFTPTEAAAWLGTARCFEADSARELATAGITPEQAAKRITAPLGGYDETVGYIYANGDIDLDTVKKEVK